MKKEIKEIINEWKKEPSESAEKLIDYYGEPNEYSANRLIWHNTWDRWKRTVLSN